MRHLRRLMVLFVTAGLGVALVAPPAGAKVLPFQMAVVGTEYQVGRPVNVIMYPDPANFLPAQHRLGIRWIKLRKLQQLLRLDRVRGRGVLLHQVGPREYRGSFKPKTSGHYVLFQGGSSPANQALGWPAPIVILVNP